MIHALVKFHVVPKVAVFPSTDISSHICPRTLSVPRGEEFSKSVTVNVEGLIMFKDKYPSNRGYCVYFSSNLFHNARSFENWEIFNNYSMSQRWI